MQKHYNSGNITKKMLLKGLFDSDNNDHITSLHYAVQKGHLDMVKLLISFGCDKEIQNYHNETPLITAAIYNYPDIARYLISIGCNINVVDILDRTCLHFAIHHETTNMLALLLEFNTPINRPDYWGYTPLYSTINQGDGDNKYVDHFQFLLLHGGKINRPNKDGDTFIDIMYRYYDHKILERMIDLCSFLPIVRQDIHMLIRNAAIKHDISDIHLSKYFPVYAYEIALKHQIMALRSWDERLTDILQFDVPKITEDEVVDIRYRFYFNRSLVSRLLIYSEWTENTAKHKLHIHKGDQYSTNTTTDEMVDYMRTCIFFKQYW
jgi:hypothetical protein